MIANKSRNLRLVCISTSSYVFVDLDTLVDTLQVGQIDG